MVGKVKTVLLAGVAALLVLPACSGNPFLEPPEEPETEVEQLPGTTNPAPNRAITRYEDRGEGATSGNGYAENFTYDPVTNSYTVDNLAFDADNAYRQNGVVRTMGAYGVYEPASVVRDPRTNAPIGQFPHRMLAGASPGRTVEFAIVRTGAYRSYGFGGFVLRRSGGVTLPTDAQVAFEGPYAAVRDFSGSSGLEYATGDVDIAIDLRDFNDGRGVYGFVTNRQIFDINGTNITSQVLARMDDVFDPQDLVGPSTQLPVLAFKVGPGAIDANGEIRGLLDSGVTEYSTGTGGVVIARDTVFEEGNYYAIVSGDADEVVGVIVVEADDVFNDGGKVRETGGFILTRAQP